MSKTPYITLALSFAAVGLLAIETPAQNDDLLIVEKRTDLAARNRMLAHLRRIIVTVNFEDVTVKEVARYLQTASGGTVNFIVSTKKTKIDDYPKTTLALKSIDLASLMSVIEDQTGLRFTFNSGMVFIKPKDEVKAFAYLRIYDVRAAVFKATVFTAPRLGLRSADGDDGFTGGSEEEPVPINGYDSDQLVEMVRSNAVPDTWDAEGISIDALNGVLLVRQSVRGHQEVKEMLMKLGAVPRPRRIVLPDRRVLPMKPQTRKASPAKKGAPKKSTKESRPEK